MRAQAAGHLRILFRHILPNCLSPLVVQATFNFAYAVLAEASLCFVGAGAPPPAPSWGNILSEGRIYMQNAPWITIFPGVAIALTVLGLNLAGDGLRDVLDPRKHGCTRDIRGVSEALGNPALVRSGRRQRRG